MLGICRNFIMRKKQSKKQVKSPSSEISEIISLKSRIDEKFKEIFTISDSLKNTSEKIDKFFDEINKFLICSQTLKDMIEEHELLLGNLPASARGQSIPERVLQMIGQWIDSAFKQCALAIDYRFEALPQPEVILTSNNREEKVDIFDNKLRFIREKLKLLKKISKLCGNLEEFKKIKIRFMESRIQFLLLSARVKAEKNDTNGVG